MMHRVWSALLLVIVVIVMIQIAAAALQPWLPLIGSALAILVVIILVIGGIRLIRLLLKNY